MSSAQPMSFDTRKSHYQAANGGPRLTAKQGRRLNKKLAHAFGHDYTEPLTGWQDEVQPLRLSADDILRSKVHIRLSDQSKALEKAQRSRIPAFLRKRGGRAGQMGQWR